MIEYNTINTLKNSKRTKYPSIKTSRDSNTRKKKKNNSTSLKKEKVKNNRSKATSFSQKIRGLKNQIAVQLVPVTTLNNNKKNSLKNSKKREKSKKKI